MGRVEQIPVGQAESPEWIRSALGAGYAQGAGAYPGEREAGAIAQELLERLPLDRMVRVVTESIERIYANWDRIGRPSPEHISRNVIQCVVAVLSAPYEDTETFCEIYADALNALRQAGVPWTIAVGTKILTLAERIRWLARRSIADFDLSDVTIDGATP